MIALLLIHDMITSLVSLLLCEKIGATQPTRFKTSGFYEVNKLWILNITELPSRSDKKKESTWKLETKQSQENQIYFDIFILFIFRQFYSLICNSALHIFRSIHSSNQWGGTDGATFHCICMRFIEPSYDCIRIYFLCNILTWLNPQVKLNL